MAMKRYRRVCQLLITAFTRKVHQEEEIGHATPVLSTLSKAASSHPF